MESVFCEDSSRQMLATLRTRLLVMFAHVGIALDESGKALADELCVYDEVIDPDTPHTIFDPNATWKTNTLTNFTVKELQIPIFKNGKRVYELPSIHDIQAYCTEQVGLLWEEVQRFENPHTYYVDLSRRLWDIKRLLLQDCKS